jgi:hypothetical protein
MSQKLASIVHQLKKIKRNSKCKESFYFKRFREIQQQ